MAIGGASEYFSGGAATPLSVPLMMDGGSRFLLNAQRLFMYANGQSPAANVFPTSGGALIGKLGDMAFGVNSNSLGLGQAIGGWANDLSSFVITGGNASSLSTFLESPSLSTGLNYGFSMFSYPYSMYNDIPTK